MVTVSPSGPPGLFKGVTPRTRCMVRGHQRTYIFRSFSDLVLLLWYQDFLWVLFEQINLPR